MVPSSSLQGYPRRYLQAEFLHWSRTQNRTDHVRLMRTAVRLAPAVGSRGPGVLALLGVSPPVPPSSGAAPRKARQRSCSWRQGAREPEAKLFHLRLPYHYVMHTAGPTTMHTVPIAHTVAKGW
jgi:hypothetical protein